MFRRSLLVVVALTACGDDGSNRHLADAPPLPDMTMDMPIDTPITPPKDLELGITAGGNGTGRITSTPAGIDCGSTCTASFEDGTMVTLTAEPDTSSVFTGWGGACSGTSPVCEVTITEATSVTATFTLKTYTVSVTKAGAGDGTIAGNGIDCGSTCEITVDHGTQISLTATPVTLNNFVGWGGACTGTGTCDLTITADTDISAAFALDDLSLIVTRGGNGAGTITSNPAGINCPGTCDFVFQANQMVTLTAAAAGSSNFTGWSGACSGMGTCMVTMDAAKTVTATFTLKRYTLGVTKTGSTGTGTVTSSPGGIACGTDCDEDYNHGQMITLTATPTMGTSSFTGWTGGGGGCSGTAPCTVTLTAATTVNAVFTINSYALTTSIAAGMGTITSMDGGIDCPGDCMQSYTHGTPVTLSAEAATGYTFTGWGGACSGTGSCIVTMDQIRSVSASFMINSYDLDVTVTGMGTVTASQISCPGDCQGTFTHGTVVTLTQAEATGYTFTGWGGACSGTGSCVVTMNGARSVTATFTIKTYALTASIVGTNGSGGTVDAVGISCPGDCSQTFDHGAVVNVTQTPNSNSNFTGWSGACSGTGACMVTMDGPKTVTANYAIKRYTLMANIVGNGSVSATGIMCPTDCMEDFNHGSVVTVSQSAGSGYLFTGWTGACTGTGACMVTMDMAQSVTATFTQLFTLDVAIAGSTGTVTSMPSGISCGTATPDCSEDYLSGTMVMLTAAGTGGATFASWTNAPGCTTSATCTVTMSQARSVTANFTPPRTLTVATSGNGTGNVVSVPAGAINCGTGGTNCTETVPNGSMITISATATTPGSQFDGFSGGGCSTSPCTVTLDASKTVTATFSKTKHRLTINGITGFGKIDSSPAGITGCTTVGSANCTTNFDYGTIVTLTPSNGGTSAAQASVFSSWGGACAGQGTICTLTITTNTTVSASFQLAPNIMFTTSTTYTGALPNAQATCSELAGNGGIQGDGPGQNKNWVYMISFNPTSNFNAVLAQVGNPTGWVRPDGKPVFQDIASLAVNKVYYPPRLDEKGNDLGQAPRVWTGTNSNGTFSNACTNSGGIGLPVPWAGQVGISSYGIASASSGMLANFRPGNQSGAQSCDQFAHLYCMGIDRQASVGEAPYLPGRIAFTSDTNAPFNQGIQAMDAFCKAQATQGGLTTGSFKAFVPALLPNGYDGCTQSNGCPVTAIGRFKNGEPWVRAGDRIPIVDRAADLNNDATKLLVTAPNALANGTRIDGNIEHWSGSLAPMQTGNQDCANWTDAASLGRAGFVGDTSFNTWWDFPEFRQRCASGDTRRVLCFQE